MLLLYGNLGFQRDLINHAVETGHLQASDSHAGVGVPLMGAWGSGGVEEGSVKNRMGPCLAILHYADY